MATEEQFKAAIVMIADGIEEVARIAGPLGAPSGVVYAALMSIGLSLDSYQMILDAMVDAGRIVVSGDRVRLGPNARKVEQEN